MTRRPLHPVVPRSLAALGMLAALPGTAAAHPGHGAAGLLHGLAHPLTGLDHLLAVVAVGLWGAQRGGRHLWALPASFVALMLVGGVLGRAAVPMPGVDGWILSSVVILGVLVALAVRAPLPSAAALVGGLALFHGHAHGAEMPAGVHAPAYAMGLLLATALLHASGIMGAAAAARLRTPRPGWVRLAGAAIAVGGVALWAG
jgi:urease accessory protein